MLTWHCEEGEADKATQYRAVEPLDCFAAFAMMKTNPFVAIGQDAGRLGLGSI
jgi:hypothetical protein